MFLTEDDLIHLIEHLHQQAAAFIFCAERGNGGGSEVAATKCPDVLQVVADVHVCVAVAGILHQMIDMLHIEISDKMNAQIDEAMKSAIQNI